MPESPSLAASLAPNISYLDFLLEKVCKCHGASEQLAATLEHGPVDFQDI